LSRLPGNRHWFEQEPHSLSVMGRSAIARTVAAILVESIAGVLKERAHATIVPSAGRTHVDTFAVLRARYAQALDWSRVICLQMDEYADIGSADGRSLSAQIESEFVAPLRIGRYLRFFDASGRAERTLEAYEKEIAALGGIDCAIHGVGVNAHIGFNEPGAIHSGRTRRVELARATQRANGVSFTHGVTLGLENLVAARNSIVVLTGSEKRLAARELLYGPVGAYNPVGHLRCCRRLAIYLDQAAAGEIWPHNVRQESLL
jgi:glucosamine-6-phosphate deaminase